MKIKLLVLLTGSFMAIAYLVGCGGGGSNNNSSCAAGQTWNGSTCIVGYGAYGASQCTQYGVGSTQYNSCLQSTCAQYGTIGTAQYQQCMTSTGVGMTPGMPGYTGYPTTTGYPYSGGYPYTGYTGYAQPVPVYPIQQPIYWNPMSMRQGYVGFDIGW